MTTAFPKRRRIHLDAHSYNKLRLEILRRDGWRCQLCGKRQNLEVHHIQLRSHSGHDTRDNLITLCVDCHATTHRRTSKWLLQQ